MTRSRSRISWVGVDERLARELVASQFPQWAHLPIEQILVASTDNVSFHLGDDLVVRIPWVRTSSRHVLKEWRWLQRLAPLLPFPIPEPVALGRPQGRLPWRWSILRWLDGDPLDLATCDLDAVTVALAEWINTLHQVDLQGGPPAGGQNGCRGTSLAKRDHYVRSTIAAKADLVDADAMTAAWLRSLTTPKWSAAPTWVHGDLHPGNLLARDGRLSAVIDFGCLAIGDPAVDLMVAWNLPNDQREQFRSIIDVDHNTWLRGRGCALYQWIGGLDPTNPDNEAARVIHRVLDDERERTLGSTEHALRTTDPCVDPSADITGISTLRGTHRDP